MKAKTIISIIVLCTFIVGCTNRQKQQNVIIGGADETTEIVITEKSGKPDMDTVIYELPGYCLWYTKKLPDEYKNQGFQMWTEHKTYWEHVAVVNVFVTNPTNEKFWFGRGWILHIWDGEKWSIPPTKFELNFKADACSKIEAPLLYCFRFPIGKYFYLPKGKYRISKSFTLQGRDDIDLSAEFEIN